MKNHNLKINIQHYVTIAIFLLIVIMLQTIIFSSFSFAKQKTTVETDGNLSGLSGLVWLKDDLFLGVHDTKILKENKSRVSLINLPQSSEGITWKPLKINWKSVGGIAMDLESITQIPETNLFILAESSNYKKYRSRLFLMQFEDSNLKPIAITNWPESIDNIEAIAVTKLNNQLYFFYAERGTEKPNTNICGTTLSLEPFKIGDCHATRFSTPDPTLLMRHISDLAIDPLGNIYVASAFDPNQNNGPFKSSVWKIGNVELDQTQSPVIKLASKPDAIAKIDGFKVESLAIRPTENERQEIFIGTDDENYGGAIRLLPNNNTVSSNP